MYISTIQNGEFYTVVLILLVIFVSFVFFFYREHK